MANPINYTYSDLKIIDDDVALDETDQPTFIYDRDVIDQDIRHAIRESGLLELMIGERSKAQRAIMVNKLRILVESDPRVIPGTSEIVATDIENFKITADTDFGLVAIGVGT